MILFDPSYSPYRMEFMQPHHLKASIKKCPVALVPLGTLEWHGHQNPIGLDSLKAHGICLATAKALGGGAVFPPCYDTGLVAPVYNYDKDYFGSLKTNHLTCSGVVTDYLVNLERTGFKVVILYGGHGPAGGLAKEIQNKFQTDMEVWACTEGDFDATNHQGDHAGFIESSLMLALMPEYVDMQRLLEKHEDNLYDNLTEGVFDAKDRVVQESNAEAGQKMLDGIVAELVTKIKSLLEKQGGKATREYYVGSPD